MSNVKALATLTVLLTAGCTDLADNHDDPAPVGLSIEHHDATALVGSFGDGARTIRFHATAPMDDRARLEMTVNGKAMRYEALAATGEHDGWYRVEIDHVIDADDIAVAQAALDALVAELGHETTAMALYEASVPKMAYHLAQQPPGAWAPSFERREYSVSTPLWSLNDDGRVCIKKNTTVTAHYDNQAGTPFAVGVVVSANWGTSACGSGNYSCMGRCGAGCNGFGGGWTLDCLEHDACSHDLCASGGSSDRNCGDEYNHASSDIFSSCSGN